MDTQPATSRIMLHAGLLVSLWDMNKFFVSELYSFMETLKASELKLAQQADAQVSEQDRRRILETTNIIWRHCQNAELGVPSDALTFLCGQLMRRVGGPAYEGYGQSKTIYQDIKTFRESLINALEPKCFLYMPDGDVVEKD
jgi:hypothetical protein